MKYKQVAVLTNMHIEDNKRGKRKGTELLEEFIANARAKKAEAIILIVDTNEANEFELIEWYEKYNFIIVHENKNSYPVMLKIL
jgi:ribosomal protein S18 acetylase RimI-like enzyme